MKPIIVYPRISDRAYGSPHAHGLLEWKNHCSSNHRQQWITLHSALKHATPYGLKPPPLTLEEWEVLIMKNIVKSYDIFVL